MTNAELLAKIKAEFETRLKILREDDVVRQNCTSDFLEGKIHGYETLLSFLDILESEKPMNQEGLEEEISRYLREECSDDDEPGIQEIAEHFAEWGYLQAAEKYDEIEYNRQRAEESVPNDLEEAAEEFAKDAYPDKHNLIWMFKRGAKWQEEQDQETIELAEDHAYFAGSVNEREKMLKEAVEGFVATHLTSEGTKVTVNSGYLPKEMCIKPGDKVRLIVLKKED